MTDFQSKTSKEKCVKRMINFNYLKYYNKRWLTITSMNQFIQNKDKITPVKFITSNGKKVFYNKVFAVDYNGRSEFNHLYVKNGESQRLRFEIVENFSKINSNEVVVLENIFFNKNSYSGFSYACFEPKMALVFYNGYGFQFEIDICLDCNLLRTSIPIDQIPSKDNYSLDGFTRNAYNQIVSFSKALNLNYGNKKLRIN